MNTLIEKVVNGVLCWKATGTDDWTPFTLEELTRKLLPASDTALKDGKVYGVIRVGAIVNMDFSGWSWPDLPNVKFPGKPVNPNTVFRIENLSGAPECYNCTADGFGFHRDEGEYGNGSIFVSKEDVILL